MYYYGSYITCHGGLIVAKSRLSLHCWDCNHIYAMLRALESKLIFSAGRRSEQPASSSAYIHPVD